MLINRTSDPNSNSAISHIQELCVIECMSNLESFLGENSRQIENEIDLRRYFSISKKHTTQFSYLYFVQVQYFRFHNGGQAASWSPIITYLLYCEYHCNKSEYLDLSQASGGNPKNEWSCTSTNTKKPLQLKCSRRPLHWKQSITFKKY